jgi:hypothetical protein
MLPASASLPLFFWKNRPARMTSSIVPVVSPEHRVRLKRVEGSSEGAHGKCATQLKIENHLLEMLMQPECISKISLE